MDKVDPNGEKSYRIVSDPYHKWISIEAYKEGIFTEIIYDSRFLDFRKLKPHEQLGWRREVIDPDNSWIYNEDDRLILKERTFYGELGDYRLEIYSPYSMLLCYYVMEQGPLGPCILYDCLDHVVMSRRFNLKQKKMIEIWGEAPPKL